MANTTMAQNLLAQIMPTIRNFNLTDLRGTITHIIPKGLESINHGVSTFVFINTEKYNNFVSSMEEGDSFALQLIGLIGYKLYEARPFILMYLHLILAALFPIIIGSYASLSRPISAAKPAKKASDHGEDEDGTDDELPEKAMDTLDKTDALMFPVIAGILLTGLYFLIKWLEDPAILNRLMGWYFSLMGIGAVGKLATDALNVVINLVFPSKWFSFIDDKTYHIDPLLSQQFIDSQDKNEQTVLHRKLANNKTTPLPGLISNSKLLTKYSRQLWEIRALLTERWLFKGYTRGLFSFKTNVRLTDAMGLGLGVLAISVWNLSGWWFTTNLMGWGICYAGFQYMSPTTFSTGSLLLIGLFFYDITMVFYTPMMVKVATSLDVPIKLVFPGPKRGSMLGLGDIVLPGLMIALALRFDLYLYYLRKQTRVTESIIPQKRPRSPKSGTSGSSMNTSHIVKAPYVDVAGQWGDWFWTLAAPKKDRPDTFPKVYFKAGIIGYISGLIITLLFLNIFNHAQPALLYLVPGVLIALWTTGLLRREIGLMLSYSEAAQEIDDDNGVAKDKRTGEGKNGYLPLEDSTNTNGEKKISTPKTEESGKEEKQKHIQEQHSDHVFMFSLSMPKKKFSEAKVV